MSRVTRFEDLIAWQKGRALVAAIYRTSESSRTFAHDFTLKDQIRGAAISVPSNIAEGFERGRLGEFHQSLSIAKASCAEVRTQLYLAFDVQHIDEAVLGALLKQAEE